LRRQQLHRSIYPTAGQTTSGVAVAHDHRESGKYQLTVGFIVEPAYEGLKNGLDLRVIKSGEEEAEGETAMDLEEHGAIFSSPALAQGETFNVEAAHDLENLTLPYHNHLNHEMTGSIIVSHDAELSGTQDAAVLAEGKTSSARTLGILGIVLGVAGIVSGSGGVAAGMRRR
jgi:hypothetical protein